MCAQAGHSFNATSPSMAAVTLPGVALLRLKLVQKLPEGHFSCPTGPRHRGKKDQTLFPATYLRILQRILHIRRWWLIAPHLLPPAISCLLTSLSTAAVQ